MNSPVRSLDKPKNHTAYLRFGLKQNWQQLVFYTIVMLLACVVTSIIGITSELEYITNSYSKPDPARLGGDLFRDIALILSVVSCVLGVFSGMASTGYVNSRRAIHCYHSLPLTRDALYLEGSAVQGLYYLAASLSSMLISALCIALRLGIDSAGLGEGMLLILTGIGGYLLVFSLFQLSGTLTGTAVFRFIMAGLIAFLPIVVYFIIYMGVAEGMQNILVDYYMDYDHIRFLCPAFNIFYAMGISYGDSFIEDQVLPLGYRFWSIATVYITAAFYYLLGLWLHRKRRSELSESSLIWKKLVTIVKYPVIFVAGAGGAVFFRAIFGTDVTWMLFGGFCGLLLSFLLMNVLISKNTKSMFKGLPGLGITALVVAVFLAIIPFDIFRFNNFMYETDEVESVTVYYGNKELELTDPAEISAVMTYIQNTARESTGNSAIPYDDQFMHDTAFYIDPARVLNQSEAEARGRLVRAYADRGVLTDPADEEYAFVWMSGGQFDKYMNYTDDVYYAEASYAYAAADIKPVAELTAAYDPSYQITTQYSGDYNYDWDRLEVSVYPKFGIPIHRYMRISEVSDNAAVYDVLHSTVQYRNTYTDIAAISAEDIDILNVELMGEHVTLNADEFIIGDTVRMYGDEQSEAVMAKYRRLLDTLLSAASQYTPEMAETPVIGTLTISAGEYYHTFSLHTGMTAFWDAWLAFWEQIPEFMSGTDGKLSFTNSLKNYYDMLRYTNYTLYESGEEILDWVSTFHTDTYIIEADTGRALYVEAGEMPQVLENSMLNAHGSTTGERDTRYLIVTRCYNTDVLKEGVENLLEKDGGIADAYTSACFFRKDAVPQFVLDAFAE